MVKKEELDKLMKIKGEVNGVVFQTDAAYVLEKKGKSGLKELEKRVKQLDYDIDYENPNIGIWYPVGLRAISLVLMKETFNWSDQEIRMIGKSAPRSSFIVKTLVKYFVSVKKILQTASQLWHKHYKDIGKVETIEVDERKKETILRVKDFKVHPLYCLYLEGYFESIVSLGIRGKNIRTKETKCVFKGDPYCDFKTNWE